MEYKKLIFDEKQILNLYLDNQWLAYTSNPKELFEGIKNSLDCIGAYDNNLLTGLIRTVGDGLTIIYIQDILILKSYQRQGVGKELMNYILDKYKNVRQILLTTDNQEASKKFYETLGYKEYSKINLVGYFYKK